MASSVSSIWDISSRSGAPSSDPGSNSSSSTSASTSSSTCFTCFNSATLLSQHRTNVVLFIAFGIAIALALLVLTVKIRFAYERLMAFRRGESRVESENERAERRDGEGGGFPDSNASLFAPYANPMMVGSVGSRNAPRVLVLSQEALRAVRMTSNATVFQVSSNDSSKPKGLKPKQLAALSEIFEYSQSGGGLDLEKGFETKKECGICLGEYLEKESVRRLVPCGHAFHMECIDSWLSSHASCPFCRKNLVPEEEGRGKGKEGERDGRGEASRTSSAVSNDLPTTNNPTSNNINNNTNNIVNNNSIDHGTSNV